MIGQVLPVREDSLDVQLYYEHPNGKLFLGDSIEWLKSLANDSVDLVFADPPYNIKKTEWDTFESQEAYIEWSIRWIKEAARVLKNTGSLYICGFSEILADLKHPASRSFHSSHWLIWSYPTWARTGGARMKAFCIFGNHPLSRSGLTTFVSLTAITPSNTPFTRKQQQANMETGNAKPRCGRPIL